MDEHRQDHGQSFSSLRRGLNIPWPITSTRVLVPAGFVDSAIRRLVRGIAVNEAWYLVRYPDIAGAVAQGSFKSATHHYRAYGFFEDRMPDSIAVNEEFYLRAYPDVAAQIAASRIASAQSHFETYGFKEGRLPQDGWSLFT
jgi:hypothetical protein